MVEYGGVRFLLLVCYDLRFPVWSRCRGDYDAILCCASWPAPRREVWRTLLRARAIENQCYAAGVNRVGDDPAARYAGDSALVDFKGRTMVEAGGGERILTGVFDTGALAAFREKFPAWRDADEFVLKFSAMKRSDSDRTGFRSGNETGGKFLPHWLSAVDRLTPPLALFRLNF